MERTHDLESVLHPAKLPRDLRADFIRDKSFRRGKGCEIVKYVVLAGNADFGFWQDGPFLCPAYTGEDAVFKISALGDRLPVRKMADMCSRKAFIIGRVRIVCVQDQAAAFRLVNEDLPFGVDIVLKVLMLVEMVGGQIRDHRDIRAAVHAVELEGAELQHHNVVRAHVRDLTQERIADVAAQVYTITGRLEQLGDDG